MEPLPTRGPPGRSRHPDRGRTRRAGPRSRYEPKSGRGLPAATDAGDPNSLRSSIQSSPERTADRPLEPGGSAAQPDSLISLQLSDNSTDRRSENVRPACYNGSHDRFEKTLTRWKKNGPAGCGQQPTDPDHHNLLRRLPWLASSYPNHPPASYSAPAPSALRDPPAAS